MINYFGLVLILVGILLVIKPTLRLLPKLTPRSVGARYKFGPENHPKYHALIGPESPWYSRLYRISGIILIILGILYFFGILNIGFAK